VFSAPRAVQSPDVARYASAALVAALLLATGAAFAYAEKLKLTKSPILGTQVTKVFSPVCECPTDVATIGFRLREADRLSVDVVDARGEPVRQLVSRQREPAGPLVLVWNGRDDAGRLVPEGAYRPRVRLLDDRRTITLPNPIRVDVTAPRFESVSIRPRVISPDGDGRNERAVVRYALSEPARVTLFVGGVRAVVKRGTQTQGAIRWSGRAAGEPPRPGAYELTLAARDVAGNAGPRTRPRTVVVRYVALGRPRIETRPGARFAVLVRSDARRIEWRLGARSGVAAPGTLRFRAPTRPGRYTLTVVANGQPARAAVLVRRVEP
jgi:hypothetical protein